jgi:membrane protein
MAFKQVWTVDWGITARRVWHEMVLDDCFGASAQLAFYFMMGFLPFVLFLAAFSVSLARLPPVELEQAVFGLLAEVMPAEALGLVRSNVTDLLGALQAQNFRLLVVSGLLALWPASGGMRSVIVTLNRAWNVREGRGPWRVLAVSIVLTIALGGVFLIALPLLSFNSSIQDQVLATHGAAWANAWRIGSRCAAAAALVFGMEFIYHVAPNARRPWRWITAGSIVAVLLWLVATWLFARYVSRFGRYEALYAGLGAPVVLLLWFYLTGLAIMVGGEINAEIERQSGILPQAVVPAPPHVDAAGHDTSLRDGAVEPAVGDDPAARRPPAGARPPAGDPSRPD